jgi:glycine/sarcosine N-methyltransferase
VLDAACGTGQHAIALARRGYDVAGADLSAGMIERASANAKAESVAMRFVKAGFGRLSAQVGAGFDALLCLGNSLPHLLTLADLASALADFAMCLRPGGVLLIQNRNFDRVLARRERWMEPQSYREGDREWLFLRMYDFRRDGLLDFHVLTLQRKGSEAWTQRVATSPLWPQREGELTAALAEAGFAAVISYGNLAGAPFEPDASPNLVLTARRGS